jgi:hypothetical protein
MVYCLCKQSQLPHPAAPRVEQELTAFPLSSTISLGNQFPGPYAVPDNWTRLYGAPQTHKTRGVALWWTRHITGGRMMGLWCILKCPFLAPINWFPLAIEVRPRVAWTLLPHIHLMMCKRVKGLKGAMHWGIVPLFLNYYLSIETYCINTYFTIFEDHSSILTADAQ